jgi:hypothetical protein
MRKSLPAVQRFDFRIQEDVEHGADRRGDEIPAHVKAKVRQLLKIRESKARLETAAEEKARVIAREREEREKETGRPSARRPRALEGKPEDRAQSNFTDPESRIMKTGNGYVATGRQKHGQSSATNERDVSRLPFTSSMRRRLRCADSAADID